MFSFHGCHSGKFCLHAKDTLEDIVEQCYLKGASHIGLTEHMPRQREQDLYPEEIGKLQLLEPNFIEYHNTAVMLKEKYKGKMEIIIAFECEYISDCPGFLDYVLEWQKKLNFTYFVGSVHHVKGIPIDINQSLYDKAVLLLGSEELLHQCYYDEQYEMLTTLKPVTIGHFDLIRLFKSDKDYFYPSVWERIERNIKFISSYGGIVELNTKAYKKGLKHPYPHPSILQIMKKHKIKFTLADDSHSVAEVFQFYDKIFEYCVAMDIKVLHRLESDLSTTEITVQHLMTLK